MAGDISRSSFSPLKHFSSVRMQQGRVQTDSDWNEEVDIGLHLTRTAALDLIGPYGAPVNNAGFGITAPGGVLTIGAGRMYVNGILCENEQSCLVSAANNPPGQPDLLNEPLPPLSGDYTLYLDVWERDITALDDPSILEVALGGVDTTTRKRVVWQVKWMADVGCNGNIAAWQNSSTGKMSAMAQPNAGSATPCAMPAQAGYTSLENQLYRVEVHTPGPAAAATFKWSRDNGSVVAGWVSSPASNQIVVTSLGRDATLSFSSGDWVELTDDTHELSGIPGTLVQLSVAQMVGLSPTLTLDLSTASGPTGKLSFPTNPKVRRWDQVATGSVTLTKGAVPLAEGSWLPLENGVQVEFAPGGIYNTGDYWLVPARTATVMSSPQVVWPVDPNGNLIAQPNLGIWHSYAPLATVSVDAKGHWTVLTDCRLFFGPQATSAEMHVVGASVLQPAAPLLNDATIPITTLLGGIKITCDQPLDPNTIKLPTYNVLLDTAVYSADSATTGQYPAASPLRLLANYAVGDTNNVSAFWIPTPETRSYVLEQMATFAAQTRNSGRALVDIRLRGNFISSTNAASSLLNGPAFGFDAGGQIELNLPSGNDSRGGDFKMWCWVPGYTDPTFPANYMPFTQIFSIAGPDATGDYVVVGEMSPASFQTFLTLQEPDTTARKIYTNPIQIGPGLSVYAYVPNNLERGGNFSNFNAALIDPTTGGPFAGNLIPTSEQPFYLTPLIEFKDVPALQEEIPNAAVGIVGKPVISATHAGVFAWRIRGKATTPSQYGYGYGYSGGVGLELI